MKGLCWTLHINGSTDKSPGNLFKLKNALIKQKIKKSNGGCVHFPWIVSRLSSCMHSLHSSLHPLLSRASASPSDARYLFAFERSRAAIGGVSSDEFLLPRLSRASTPARAPRFVRRASTLRAPVKPLSPSGRVVLRARLGVVASRRVPTHLHGR